MGGGAAPQASNPWSRVLQSPCARSLRFGLGVALVLALVLLAGCTAGSSDGGESIGAGAGGSGGGNGGSGGSDNPPPDPPPDPGPTPTPVPSLEAMLGWDEASGPVAGYSVMISRNAGAFQLERETPEPRVLVSGAEGDVLRIRVAAFDAAGNSGPLSPASHPIVFVGPPDTTSTAAATETTTQTANAPSDPGPGSVVSGATEAGSDAGTGGDAAPAGSRPRADFDGDGAADLVWESTDATLVRVSNADLSSARLYTIPAGGWRIRAIADFDADGLSDLLFAAAGELALARAAAFPAGPGELTLETWARPGAGSEVVASGDFDADGSADAVILDAAGASLWLAAGDVLALPALGSASLAGAGDGDGDGSDDLVLSDAQGFSLWRVVAGEVVSATALPAPEGAALLGVADFDGDGADELALRSAPEAMTLQRARSPFGAWLEAAAPGASLAGCGDYDGDGVPDRLWESADSLRIVSSAGSEQVVALDAGSPWRLVHDCQ